MQIYRKNGDGQYNLHEVADPNEVHAVHTARMARRSGGDAPRMGPLFASMRAQPVVSVCTDCNEPDCDAARLGVSCKKGHTLHPTHPRIAVAYYLETEELATHGSPDSMLMWAALHNQSSPHKVALYAFPEGAPVDDVNDALHDPAALRARLAAAKEQP